MIFVDRYVKDEADVNIDESVYCDVDRSVFYEVVRGINGGVDSDIDAEVGIVDGELV